MAWPPASLIPIAIPLIPTVVDIPSEDATFKRTLTICLLDLFYFRGPLSLLPHVPVSSDLPSIVHAEECHLLP